MDKEKGFHPRIELGNLPRENCKKCYGRGHVGRDSISGYLQACPCTNPSRTSKGRREADAIIQEVLGMMDGVPSQAFTKARKQEGKESKNVKPQRTEDHKPSDA